MATMIGVGGGSGCQLTAMVGSVSGSWWLMLGCIGAISVMSDE